MTLTRGLQQAPARQVRGRSGRNSSPSTPRPRLRRRLFDVPKPRHRHPLRLRRPLPLHYTRPRGTVRELPEFVLRLSCRSPQRSRSHSSDTPPGTGSPCAASQSENALARPPAPSARRTNVHSVPEATDERALPAQHRLAREPTLSIRMASSADSRSGTHRTRFPDGCVPRHGGTRERRMTGSRACIPQHCRLGVPFSCELRNSP